MFSKKSKRKKKHKESLLRLFAKRKDAVVANRLNGILSCRRLIPKNHKVDYVFFDDCAKSGSKSRQDLYTKYDRPPTPASCSKGDI